MLIKSITLNNFRQYIGRQEVAFSTDKERNVTVLNGMNTAGKTTFVRAFEWILYGKIEFDDRNLLNQNIVDNMQQGETQDVSGTIVLEHDGKTYEITRTQKYTCLGEGKVRASLSNATIMYLQPDGQTKTEMDVQFDTQIEKILPKSLSSYFFFGGERVGSISSRDDVEASVKGLMGLNVLDNAINHLKTVIQKFKKGMDFSGNDQATNAQSKLEDCSVRLKNLRNDLKTLDDQIDYYFGEQQKLAGILKANEQTAENQKRREQLNSIINSLEARIEKKKKDLVQAYSRDAFAFFSIPVLKNTINMLEAASDETESIPEMSAEAIDYILHRGSCICGTCITKGSSAEKHILEEKAKLPPESIGAIVRRFREQANDYLSTSDLYFDRVEDLIRELHEAQRDLGFRIDEREDLSKLLEGVEDVSRTENQYQEAVKKHKEFLRQKDVVLKNIGSCEKDIENLEKAIAQFSKSNEKNARISQYIAYASATLEWISEAYKKREIAVRERLESQVNKNFSNIYHGTRNITIDDKYRVKYVDVTTEESEGLKAVKSFAFVSALVDIAKEALSSGDDAELGPHFYPLVMDAPFSNVDETHIQNISEILPKSAEQVIIAVMKKDWDQAEKTMSKYVGKSYSISKDIDENGKPIDTMTHIR